MNFFQALTLGIVQGLTEFLPVSSSGHLIIFPVLLGWEIQSLAFDTMLHLGTACALIIFFFKDIFNMIRSDRKLAINIILGSVPAGIIGFFLESVIENVFRGVFYVSIFLLVGSALMLYATKLGPLMKEKEIDAKVGLTVGLFQALALLPGISRSGATISGGLLMGLPREKAARFSFLLSIPIVVGAGLFKLIKSINGLDSVGLDILLVGFLSSFIVGMFAIKFMLNFLKKNGLEVFVVYRILLSLFLLGAHFFLSPQI